MRCQHFECIFNMNTFSKMEISRLIMGAQKTFTTHFSSDGHSKMAKQVSIEDILLKYEENTQTKGIRFFDSPCILGNYLQLS